MPVVRNPWLGLIYVLTDELTKILKNNYLLTFASKISKNDWKMFKFTKFLCVILKKKCKSKLL